MHGLASVTTFIYFDLLFPEVISKFLFFYLTHSETRTNPAACQMITRNIAVERKPNHIRLVLKSGMHEGLLGLPLCSSVV